MEITHLQDEGLLHTLNQAKAETKQALCDLFAARLERIGCHIRSHYLTPIEACELLNQEAEKLRYEHDEVIP